MTAAEYYVISTSSNEVLLMISHEMPQKLGLWITDEIDKAHRGIADMFAELEAELSRIQTWGRDLACLKEKGRKVEPSTTDTQVMLIYSESVFDSIFNKFKGLHEIVVSPSVLDWKPGVSGLFRSMHDMNKTVD
jgi:hypothetical protein